MRFRNKIGLALIIGVVVSALFAGTASAKPMSPRVSDLVKAGLIVYASNAAAVSQTGGDECTTENARTTGGDDWQECPPVESPQVCVTGPGVNSQAPVTLYFLGGSTTLSPVFANAIIDSPAGGSFYVGFLKGTSSVVFLNGALNPDDYLEPGSSGPYMATRGECSSELVVSRDREFWLCYSKGYPWVGSRADAMKLYDDGNGWKVPIAVKDQNANGPHIGNDIVLSCNFSAYKVVPDVAVSTGGGEQYSGLWADVEYKLTEMRLDYTVFGILG